MRRILYESACIAVAAAVFAAALSGADPARAGSTPELTARRHAESSGVDPARHSLFIEGYTAAYVGNLITKDKGPVYNPYAGDEGKAWSEGYARGIRDSDDSPEFTMVDFGYSPHSGPGTFAFGFGEAAFVPGRKIKQLDPEKYTEMWWFGNPLNLRIRNRCYYQAEGWVTGVGRHGRSHKYPRAFIVTRIQNEDCR